MVGENSERKINRVGVLTSGGDAPGMNAAIRAVARAADVAGAQCLGIRRGYNGLINGDIVELTHRNVSGLNRSGGTMLYTARCPEFMTQEGQQKAVDTCRYLGLDGIITIGGDGTFRGAMDLAARGVRTIGIPATIDNDIACSHYAIGFDTACNTSIECIDKLSDTMQSHERCSIVEVM
ncbi:MAG: 6-phosphofructokinase, partial [Oscillospiraceae bacterium]|nr:6-phosphofructokinase [Oscillospiraceae bacterium]